MRLRRVEGEGLLALFLALPLIVPFLTLGLPNTADAEIHLHRLISAAVNLDAGYWYPRWTPYLHHGYGYPLHNFYAPGLHLLGGAAWLFTQLDAVVIWKLLQFSATLLYPLGAYLFARTFASRAGALLAAAVYTYAPFRFDELWMQSNLSQFAAMAAIPFLFWSITRGAARARWADAGWIGFLFGAITLLHHPTGFLCAPFAGLYALWLCLTEQCRANQLISLLRRLVVPLGGLALGVGLSAVFWLPALAEFQYVQIQSIQQGQFNTVANLIPLPELTRRIEPIDRALQNPQRLFIIGQPQMLMVGLSLLALIRPVNHRARVILAISMLFFALSLWLMTPDAAWVWENVPGASLVIYPWRLLGINSLAAAACAAAVPDLLPKRWRAGAAAVLIVGTFLAVLPLLYAPLNFYSLGEYTPAEAFLYEKRTGNLGLTSGNEYLPIWAKERPLRGDPRDHTTFEWRVDVLANSLPAEASVVRILQDCPRGTTCYTVNAPRSFTLVLNQLYFPGWDIRLDDMPADVAPRGEQGLMALELPSGVHSLTIRYGGTLAQHIGTLVSGVTMLGLASLMILGRSQSDADAWIDAVPQERTVGLAAGLAVAIVSFVAFNQAYLVPYTDFMRPSSEPGSAPAAYRSSEAFGQDFVLIGYDLSTRQASPDSVVYLRLYWLRRAFTAETASVTVQLTDATGTLVIAQAQRLSLANQTLADWPPNKYAIDAYTLTIPAQAPPYLYLMRLHVQIDDARYTHDLRDLSGAPVTVRVVGHRWLVAQDQLRRVNMLFRDEVWLRGVGWRAGEQGQRCLVLRWQSERPAAKDYQVLLHWMQGEQFLEAADTSVLSGLYGMSRWERGQQLDDEYCFAQVPHEADTLAVGLYDLAEPVPLNITYSDTPATNNTLRLPLEVSNGYIP